MDAARTITLDHLVFAAPALDRGMALWQHVTGVPAQPGGRHPGNGTRNAIAPLAGGVYAEVLAPDPAQTLDGTAGERLAALAEPGLWTFCCRSGDLDTVAGRARGLGLVPQGPRRMSRGRPDGSQISWSILFLRGHGFGALMPFFIDWGEAAHPSMAAMPDAPRLQIAAAWPDAALAQAYAALGFAMKVAAGTPALTATVQGAARSVELVAPEALLSTSF
jgi:hypothetical protein